MPFATHALVLKNNGEAWGWGSNSDTGNPNGQIGDNSTTDRSSPVSVVGNHSFSLISGGHIHSLALKSVGTAWGWGDNAPNGQIGDNTTTNRSSPVAVVGNHKFVDVAAGGLHSFAIKANGAGWSWGNGVAGQIGEGSNSDRSSPVAVVGNHLFKRIAAGSSYSVGIKKSNGTAWTWGSNADGQLGDGTTTNRNSPVSVIGAHSFVDIKGATGESMTLALKADGSVWGWGRNLTGSLGDNSTTNRSSPVVVVGAHSFIQIAAVRESGLGLKADGSIWAWGQNTNGQLGNNSTTGTSSPVLVVGNHSFIQVIGADRFSFALKVNGQVWGWGNNPQGQLGDSTTDDKSSPVLVVGSHAFNLLMDNGTVLSFGAQIIYTQII